MTNRKRWTAALCLGFTLLTGPRLWAGDTLRPRQQADEIKVKMAAEGWTQIADGVYERQRGGNKVEHLGYGREGLAWTIGELTRQLNVLVQEYQSYPSENLAKIVDDLSIKIANAKRELRNMSDKGIANISAALAGPGCNICYGATVDAYALSGSSQGTGAIADAKFNSTCGLSGDTYAYAYAKATLNGTTTVVTQTDPHTGTSVTSHAAAVVNGGAPCSSTANAYAQSTALGISYTTSDDNPSSCPGVPPPPPNLSVTINGPTSATALGSCKTLTWTSTVSGGTSPYTYSWKINNVVAGTASSISKQFCGSQTIDLTLAVTDSTLPTHLTVFDTHQTFLETDLGSTCLISPCP
jgi:hypothetical protein